MKQFRLTGGRYWELRYLRMTLDAVIVTLGPGSYQVEERPSSVERIEHYEDEHGAWAAYDTRSNDPECKQVELYEVGRVR